MNTKNKIRNAIDIIGAARKKLDNLQTITAKKLLIWGGSFQEAELAEFIKVWEGSQAHFSWQMWEAVSRFDLVRSRSQTVLRPPAGNRFDDIERIRLFGNKGDLLIRRDADWFAWRFIGDPVGDGEAAWPMLIKKYEMKDYADSHGDNLFYWQDVSYLLWHRDEKEQRVSTLWADARNANLTKQEKYLNQRHYMRQGRIEFVRYLNIGEKSNG